MNIFPKTTYSMQLVRRLVSPLSLLFCLLGSFPVLGQSWKLTPENIDSTIRVMTPQLAADPMRPGFHLTPPTGCMGDPNGGIYHDGWYHIFYGLHPFAFHPGGWYWAHARSRDLLHWEPMKTGLTPAFERGLNAVGSGSTIITENGEKLAFQSQSADGPMEFWRARFTDDTFSDWEFPDPKPVLTLDHPGLPPYDKFWRDPFVFATGGRTFLIACADLFEADYVALPIFEARDEALTDWEYRGEFFRVPKHQYRNLEVPEFRQLGDKWIFLASTDAPVDRVNYFIGAFDLDQLRFISESEGVIDYSGHYYAQETIQDEEGNLFLMGWLPGWDREWLPGYMNEPLKNSHPRWNGCFAFPRQLTLADGALIQQPVSSLRELRREHFTLAPRDLPVNGPFAAMQVVEGITGNQLEIRASFELHHASLCGINVLSDEKGQGGLPIFWHGDILNVDGVEVPIKEWPEKDRLDLHILVDKKFVEVFVNGGKYCVSRQLGESFVRGGHLTLTSLGGTARLLELEAWKLASIN